MPPNVKDGLMIMGKPISFTAIFASSRLLTTADFGILRPILFIALLNNSLSSAFFIDSMFAPISFTLYLSSTPASNKPTAAFSAVWPPSVGSKCVGFSFAMIFSMNSTLIGSI